ncbi:MAG: hypothetical protein Q8S24_11005, partial [Eubacteriales bacterium]|nr:hypothetical protein [Eubacteriales bacterium]
MRDRKILALILVIVLVMSSFTFAFGVSPGLKTTDSGGNETQKNHFDTKEDVYIYGSNIPDGNYYVRVTNPGGSDNLGTSATASLVVSGGVIDPNPAKIWDYVQFADTTNSGGQYKAWISKNPDFSGDNISTKTFSVGDAIYAIDVTKVANPTSAYVGDEITYSIRVTNNSNVELTDIVVEDSMFPTLEIAPITLAAGAYKDYTVTAAAVLGTMNNTVTASSIMGDVSDTASASVVVTNRPVDPTYAIDVTKVANPTSAYVGDEITYSIRVTNNSSVELTDIVVEDSMFPTLEIAPITLAAGAYKDYTVTASAVLGTMNNTVTASSIVGDVSDTASASVVVTNRPVDPTYAIDVTKVADPTSAYVGDEITYSIRVTNNSSVELTDIVVEDS